MGDPVSEYLEGAVAVGNGGEGCEEDWGNSSGAGYAVQGSDAVGVAICGRELGSEGGHTEITRGITSSVSKKD